MGGASSRSAGETLPRAGASQALPDPTGATHFVWTKAGSLGAYKVRKLSTVRLDVGALLMLSTSECNSYF